MCAVNLIYIASRRKLLGLTQKDLAKAIDIDPVVLNRIEKGKRPIRGEELKAIANYFNVTTDYLLDNEINREPDFSNDEIELIYEYRNLNDNDKNFTRQMISRFNTKIVKSTRLPITGMMKQKINHSGLASGRV